MSYSTETRESNPDQSIILTLNPEHAFGDPCVIIETDRGEVLDAARSYYESGDVDENVQNAATTILREILGWDSDDLTSCNSDEATNSHRHKFETFRRLFISGDPRDGKTSRAIPFTNRQLLGIFRRTGLTIEYSPTAEEPILKIDPNRFSEYYLKKTMPNYRLMHPAERTTVRASSMDAMFRGLFNIALYEAHLTLAGQENGKQHVQLQDRIEKLINSERLVLLRMGLIFAVTINHPVLFAGVAAIQIFLIGKRTGNIRRYVENSRVFAQEKGCEYVRPFHVLIEDSR